MLVKEFTNKSEWEKFNLNQEWPQFLQSWNSGIQETRRNIKVYYLGIYNDEELVGICLVEKILARRSNYFFIPYGPIFKNWQKPEYFSALVEYLKEQGRREKIDFIRICPFIDYNEKNQQIFASQGFKISPLQTIAENLWVLDLNQSEESIWQAMRKTMRNLIRKAERENVIIKQEDNVENFIKLHKHTVVKHHFTPYPDQLFQEQLRAFKDDQKVVVWTAFHNNEPLASAIIMYYGNIASYHHGASIISKIPAPYLLQWKAIQEAKNRGCKYYNFWGIYPNNNPKLIGVTQFKMGFGGHQKNLLPGQDLPLSWKYSLNCLVEKYRRKKRGYVKR